MLGLQSGCSELDSSTKSNLTVPLVSLNRAVPVSKYKISRKWIKSENLNQFDEGPVGYKNIENRDLCGVKKGASFDFLNVIFKGFSVLYNYVSVHGV